MIQFRVECFTLGETDAILVIKEGKKNPCYPWDFRSRVNEKLAILKSSRGIRGTSTGVVWSSLWGPTAV